MSRLLHVVIMSAALALAGCGTSYAPTGLTGGFTDKMIADDMAVIVVSGNGFTSPDKVESILLLRASELTVQTGHQRFTLMTIEDQAALDAQKAGRLPAYLREKARDAPRPQLLTERTTVSNRYASFNVNKSGGGFFVVMFKGNKSGVFDANKLIAELRPQLQPAPAAQTASGAAPLTQ